MVSAFWETQVHQHHAGRVQHGARVGDVLPCDVRCAPVDRFEHADKVADVGTARHAHTAGELGRYIADDIAVEVEGDDHIVAIGLRGNARGPYVDDLHFLLDPR